MKNRSQLFFLLVSFFGQNVGQLALKKWINSFLILESIFEQMCLKITLMKVYSTQNIFKQNQYNLTAAPWLHHCF